MYGKVNLSDFYSYFKDNIGPVKHIIRRLELIIIELISIGFGFQWNMHVIFIHLAKCYIRDSSVLSVL